MKAICRFAFALLALGVFAAEIPKAPVPPSPYLPIIYKYADAMVERGRDTNGVFHSVLNRVTMVPLALRTSGPTPQDHQNLLRLLYTLTELSTKPKYRDAADGELRWFLANADSRIYLSNQPWMLWDRCFDLAPEASRRLAVSEWSQDSLNRPDVVTAYRGNLARDSGFFIRNCAVAYVRTTNELFLKPLDSLFGHLYESIDPATGLMRFANSNLSLAEILSLAIDCDAASGLVPKPLAERFTSFAELQDHVFGVFQHEVKANGGFLLTADFRTGKPGKQTSDLWKAGRGIATTAQVAMMCVSRYENTGNIAYRDLVHAAADAYLKSTPASEDDVWPMTFGHAISLQVAAWRSTAQQKYLDRARELADFAVKHFFDEGPLPRASLKSTHYDAGTGADTLALGLVELHLHILAITAVRYPPNTIDR
jgi:hypothetical protein